MSKKPTVNIDTVALEEQDVSLKVRIQIMEELMTQQEIEIRMLKHHLEKLKEKVFP